MRKLIASIVAVLGALVASPATADHMYVDTETLYGWCSPPEVGTSGVGPRCSGYINAVADILSETGLSPAHLELILEITGDVLRAPVVTDRNLAADILAHGLPIHDHRACIPEEVRLVDLRDLTVKALDSRPKVGHKNAHDWVARALSEAFPCN